MSNKITYRPLCKLDIWQAYYLHPVEINEADLVDAINRPNVLKTSVLESIIAQTNAVKNYSVHADLKIVPTRDTDQKMKAHKMQFRLTDSGFHIYIRAKENNNENVTSHQPFVPFGASFKLTFLLKVKNPAFYNFTNLETTAPLNHIYYFSNRANNEEENSLFLNKKPENNNTIQNYISSLDRPKMHHTMLSIEVEDLALDHIRFVLSSPLTTKEIICEVSEEQASLSVCKLNLNDLPAGLYQLKAFTETDTEVLELQQNFYWNNGIATSDTLGVIELFHTADQDLGNYQLLNEGTLNEPTFTLWWQNRSTFWRYIFDDIQPSPNANCPVSFEDNNAQDHLVAKEIQPLLSRYKRIFFKKALPANSEEILLPNPSPHRIYPEDNGAKVFSEIYMGKINLGNV